MRVKTKDELKRDFNLSDMELKHGWFRKGYPNWNPYMNMFMGVEFDDNICLYRHRTYGKCYKIDDWLFSADWVTENKTLYKNGKMKKTIKL